MKIYFDVGANSGGNSLHIARSDPTNFVFAFEANPHFIEQLTKEKLPNYFGFCCAVSDYEGKAKFNIFEVADRGCSSLLNLSEKAYTEWYGREDMIPTLIIEVNVIRLDSIIERYNIQEIEYFHCDTQGSDLNVLRGMGKHIRKIKSGCVEAATKVDVLYQNQNTVEETINYITENGFKIWDQESNDCNHNEVNIFFDRIGEIE